MLRKILLLLAMVVAVSATKNHTKPMKSHTGTKGDLTNKRGSLLYKAGYINVANQRTSGAFDGTFTAPDASTAAFGGAIGTSMIYSFTVADKKGGLKNWDNIFSINSNTFPSDSTPETEDSLLSETYSVTSLDGTSGALLGSLVWGGAYKAGTITGTTTTAPGTVMIFPVLGSSGVYKGAKAVRITYNANGQRDVAILKNYI